MIWVFDLDDTLYPRDSGLWSQISQRISHYIQNHFAIDDEEVQRRRSFYYKTYGGSLQGMMKESHVDADDFLSFVHDIDYSSLKQDKILYDALANLKGKKYIFTNADSPHAERTLQALGLSDIFDGIYGITEANLVPKPFLQTYRHFLNQYHLNAEDIIMFEDSLTNLKTCKQLGMTTVLISETTTPQPDYVDFQSKSVLTALQDYFQTASYQH